MKHLNRFSLLSLLFICGLMLNTTEGRTTADGLIAADSAQETQAYRNTNHFEFIKVVLTKQTPDISPKRKDTLANMMVSSFRLLNGLNILAPERPVIRTIYLAADTEKKHPISVHAAFTIDSAPYLACFIQLMVKDVLSKGLSVTSEILDKYIDAVKELPLGGTKPWEA